MTGPVAITGASGMVGSHLARTLTEEGVEVHHLVRRTPTAAQELQWDPTQAMGLAGLEGAHAIVHLAGAPLIGRWTAHKKEQIRQSRVEGTQNLCTALAALQTPPKVLVSASAVGYYGDRSEELLTETSSPGEGFLSEVCTQWEAATQAATDAGIRVIHLRSGVILDPHGGALRMMLPFFRAGLGGRIGPGTQYMPWITLDDHVRIIQHAIQSDLQGPLNGVAASDTNHDFTHALGTTLHRPTLVPLPAPAARIVFGELADAMLLASQNIRPARLPDHGFQFLHPTLQEALPAILQVAPPTVTTKA